MEVSSSCLVSFSSSTSSHSSLPFPPVVVVSSSAYYRSSFSYFTSKKRATNITCSNGNEAHNNRKPIERTPAFPTVFDIHKIQDILPHRYPLLLVDRVIEYNTEDNCIVGIKNLTINESFFHGHFPGNPIMPGVLIVEAMAQLAGIMLLQPEVGFQRDNALFLGMNRVKFRKQVIPGDTLVMKMTLETIKPLIGYTRWDGKAYVGEELVAEGEIMLAGQLIDTENRTELLKNIELRCQERSAKS